MKGARADTRFVRVTQTWWSLVTGHDKDDTPAFMSVDLGPETSV